MPSNNEVHLQFTQEDRDMLRDTNGDVKRVLTNMVAHDASDAEAFADLRHRMTELENWKIRIVAICTAGGITGGFLAKMLFH